LHSTYDEEDLRRLGFVEDILQNDFGKQISKNYSINRCVLNLSKPGDFYLNHTHGNFTVLLYYVNIRWQEEWSGETLFYNDNMKEILFATPYIPGRVILFDGKIPHTIRPQSIIAPHYRFTFTLFLVKK
jgi:Rps23 Pro-64 3,4-dihydroxylase Tpa1-like proline 4-hydroxylase